MSIGTDVLPAASTVTVLTGVGVKKLKYFDFAGFMFSPLYLSGLADDINNDYLNVRYDTSKDGSSGYSAKSNTIYLNFSYASSIEQKGMVVHEATHAMFDFQGKKMTISVSESLAYIAQCMYVQLNRNFNPNDPDDRLGSWKQNKDTGEWYETKRDGVFKKGWEIAKKIIAANSSGNSVYSVTSKDVDEMKKAVKDHPWYSSSASSYADFNGYN